MDRREREERRWCKPTALKQERAGGGMTRGEELWAEGLRRLECGAAELEGYDSGGETTDVYIPAEELEESRVIFGHNGSGFG